MESTTAVTTKLDEVIQMFQRKGTGLPPFKQAKISLPVAQAQALLYL